MSQSIFAATLDQHLVLALISIVLTGYLCVYVLDARALYLESVCNKAGCELTVKYAELLSCFQAAVSFVAISGIWYGYGVYGSWFDVAQQAMGQAGTVFVVGLAVYIGAGLAVVALTLLPLAALVGVAHGIWRVLKHDDAPTPITKS